MKKFLLSTLVTLLSAAGLYAQVTTSSITGLVNDAKGEALIGATVKAVHQPTGTRYGVSTNAEGRFIVPNARVGGPYEVEVTYIGFQAKKVSGITLKLGEPYHMNLVLSEGGNELQEVVVSVSRGEIFEASKTGVSTNISSREMATLPSISRSITDFTRITPQANGTSFAGRDSRFNNIQVDGANLNNNFGLSNDPLPGGGAQPISLDAYDQISVNIAPYDVRQSGFTGAGINAVTKSGTNSLHGAVYSFQRNENFIGTKVGDASIKSQIVESQNEVYGGTLGGPIVKDKLFFFVSGEFEKESLPGINYSPTGGSGVGTVSATPAADLQRVSDFLRTNYGYETGAFDNFPNFGRKNHKILGKLDWNINNQHKLTLKYSDFVGNNDVALNASSIPNGGGFTVTGRNGGVTRLPINRFSNGSMSFANSNYGFEDVTRSGTVELNSNFRSKMSNQLLVSFTRNSSTRTYPGSVFPTIDIFDGNGNNYISAGMDPYTYNNDVVNDVYTITDNFTYYAGKHTLTAGATYEYQKVGNMFMAGSNSYYAFNSLDDFLSNRAPAYYAYTYSLVPGQSSVYSAELKIGQLGVYAQDEYDVTPDFKLTMGIRADLPVYHEKPIANPAVSAMQFLDVNGNATSYSTGNWPKSRILLAPRVGFRWDANGDNSLILRGGTGIFTGRIPFVWLTNMPTNSGMYQFGASLSNASTNPANLTSLGSIRFNPDPNAYAGLFPTTAGTSAPNNLVFTASDFKFPQVFRTNLGVDKSLGNGFTATFDAMFTKDINAVRMFNANSKLPTGTITEGGLSRARYVDVNGDNRLDAKDRNINEATNTAIVLANSIRGYSAVLTAQLSKSFANGLYGSVAYNYTAAKEVSANPGSQASSVWNANPNVGISNFEELGFAEDYTPHRVVGNLSYRKEYARNFATTISLFYEGATLTNYSFVVNGDLNGDGNNSTDLMYIPRNAAEMNFEQYTQDGITFTVAQQQEAFEKFINNSPYLKKHRGQFSERYGAKTPWVNNLDLRFLQDFFITDGKNKRHTLQFSADVLNFSNLLNKDWGIRQRYVVNNPLTFRSINDANQPVYRLLQRNGELVTDIFEDNISTTSTWRLQFGLRYSF